MLPDRGRHPGRGGAYWRTPSSGAGLCQGYPLSGEAQADTAMGRPRTKGASRPGGKGWVTVTQTRVVVAAASARRPGRGRTVQGGRNGGLFGGRGIEADPA